MMSESTTEENKYDADARMATVTAPYMVRPDGVGMIGKRRGFGSLYSKLNLAR